MLPLARLRDIFFDIKERLATEDQRAIPHIKSREGLARGRPTNDQVALSRKSRRTSREHPSHGLFVALYIDAIITLCGPGSRNSREAQPRRGTSSMRALLAA